MRDIWADLTIRLVVKANSMSAKINVLLEFVSGERWSVKKQSSVDRGFINRPLFVMEYQERTAVRS